MEAEKSQVPSPEQPAVESPSGNVPPAQPILPKQKSLWLLRCKSTLTTKEIAQILNVMGVQLDERAMKGVEMLPNVDLIDLTAAIAARQEELARMQAAFKQAQAQIQVPAQPVTEQADQVAAPAVEQETASVPAENEASAESL